MKSILIALFASLCLSPLAAQTIRVGDAGVQIAIPGEGWSFNEEEMLVYDAENPEEANAFIFLVALEAADLDAAEAMCDKEIAQAFSSCTAREEGWVQDAESASAMAYVTGTGELAEEGAGSCFFGAAVVACREGVFLGVLGMCGLENKDNAEEIEQADAYLTKALMEMLETVEAVHGE